ncbi:MAG TPA: hypothetical protein VIJ93_01365 [bacterium]
MKRILMSSLFGLTGLIALMITWSCQSNSPNGPSLPNALQTVVAGMTLINTPTPVNTPTPTSTPCTSVNGFMGDISAEPSTFSGPATLFMNRYISPATAAYILSLEIYVTTASGSYELAVYSDNSGTPGSLLGETGTKAISGSGLNLALLSGPLPIQGSKNYWLALLTDQPILENSNGTATAFQSSVSFGLLPGTFTGAAPAAGEQFSISAGLCQ